SGLSGYGRHAALVLQPASHVRSGPADQPGHQSVCRTAGRRFPGKLSHVGGTEMKAIFNNFKKKLAQLGRSMLVPVTAMPVAGILSRIASEDMLNIPLLKAAGDI